MLDEFEYSKMVFRKLGITDMTVPNQQSLALRCSELQKRSDIVTQLVFHEQVLPPDVLTRITIGKYVAGLY